LFLTLLRAICAVEDEADRGAHQELLEEQLSDMRNLGPCPQGRTVRLWQLLQSLQ
jgi:hypothetical protein